MIGVKSTARLFGTDTPTWLRRFLVATTCLLTLAVLRAVMSNGSILALFLALVAPWAMGWHLAWQLRALDTENNERLLQLFRLNRDTGLIPLIFFAAALFA